MDPLNTIVLIRGTPQKGTPNFGKPPIFRATQGHTEMLDLAFKA